MIPDNRSHSPRARLASIKYAWQGLKVLWREPNVKIHMAATVVVIVAGVVQHIEHTRWIALVVAIGIVWITEALNTCVERLCDFACNNSYHPAIKVIKDISAAAVLIAAVISVIIAAFVFIL